MATLDSVPELDSFQRAAVAHGGGPALVLAGPGSGKTRVIVERTVRLIDDGVARPENLLVLTFSRKAASDLRERLADRLRRSYASFPVTTFHAFAYALLARGAPAPPRLARPAERRAAIDQALAAEDHLGFRPTNALAEDALAFSDLCDDYLTVPDHPLAKVRARYLENLATAGVTDYGGLQRGAIDLLRGDPALRAFASETFHYVLVDEYQDTNVAQDALLELIAGGRRNVFCVADEDQSIYGFRGAELNNTLRFDERWPGAERYALPVNYRSVRGVVELATDVIRRNVDSHQDKPLTAADDSAAELRGRLFRHPAEEADWIAREIAALRLEGVPLGEIAILARSVRNQGPRLAYALRRHGIPFHAPLAATLHPTVDALLSLIELAATWDDERALRVLASPLFGEDALELRRYRRGQGRLRDDFPDLFKALGVVRRQKNAGSAVYALWKALPYFETLTLRTRPGDAARDDVDELAAVTALSDAANEFDGAPSLFPAEFRAGGFADEGWLPAATLPPDAVALLTIHQAKGLEWDAVFVCDLVEGRFPALARSQHALFDRGLFGPPFAAGGQARRALEEERRLFYVAITRARTRLALTATEEAREETGRSLSRFYLEAQRFLDESGEREGFVSAEEALAALRRAGGGPPGWRARAETANTSAMLPTGELWTSATGLAPYENCPLRFFFGSLLRLGRARTAAMTLGGVFHDVVEAFHDPERNEPQTLERLLQLADEKWNESEVTPHALAVANRGALDLMLRNYFTLEVAAGKVGPVLAVEQRFRFQLEGVTLTGYIDRIERRPDERLRLVDFKTSKSMMPLEEAADDLQLALYALACSEVPELAALGDVGELAYVYPRVPQAGGLARRAQTVTPDLGERTEARVRAASESIVAERFDFSPEADCRWCEYKRLCPRHFGRDVPL